MGDRAEHARALADLFADTPLHQVEGRRGLLCFTRSRLVEGRAVEVQAQALGGFAQALNRPAEQLGAVPGGDDQRDELERQRHHRAAKPRTLVLEQGLHRAVRLFDKGFLGRRRGRAVIAKPGDRQHVGQHNRHQQHAKQSTEQRVEGVAHQPISRASNR